MQLRRRRNGARPVGDKATFKAGEEQEQCDLKEQSDLVLARSR
jgi:hypothetical protein